MRRQALVSDLPPSVPFILLAMLIVVVTVAPGLVPKPRPAVAPPPPPPPPPRIQVEARIPMDGFDQHHRRLPFTVYVLSQDFSWKLESTTDLDGGATLLNPELEAAVNRAREVFCIGTASYEGDTGREEARADRRAAVLSQWIEAAIQKPEQTRLFRLNAGQYKGPAELASALQRKAIIIATDGHEDGVDLSAALRSGLEKKQHEFPVVYSLLHHYSRSAAWLKFKNCEAHGHASVSRTEMAVSERSRTNP